jgi:hypothetical protein
MAADLLDLLASMVNVGVCACNRGQLSCSRDYRAAHTVSQLLINSLAQSKNNGHVEMYNTARICSCISTQARVIIMIALGVLLSP